MEKKYTEQDLIEIEKIHRENYKEIHNFIIDILDITIDKVVKNKLNELLQIVYEKEFFSQKDINISENIKISEQATGNN